MVICKLVTIVFCKSTRTELKFETFLFLAQEFEEDVETWRGSISAVNQCGDHLFQEFPQYESGELKNSMSEVNERWTNITNRSCKSHVLLVSFFLCR